MLPDPLRQRTSPIFSIFSYFPPVGGVDSPDALLEASIPPILRHLCQTDRDYSWRRFGLGLLGFVEFGENLALLSQEGRLLHAVLSVHGDCEVEDARSESQASELKVVSGLHVKGAYVVMVNIRSLL